MGMNVSSGVIGKSERHLFGCLLCINLCLLVIISGSAHGQKITLAGKTGTYTATPGAAYTNAGGFTNPQLGTFRVGKKLNHVSQFLNGNLSLCNSRGCTQFPPGELENALKGTNNLPVQNDNVGSAEEAEGGAGKKLNVTSNTAAGSIIPAKKQAATELKCTNGDCGQASGTCSNGSCGSQGQKQGGGCSGGGCGGGGGGGRGGGGGGLLGGLGKGGGLLGGGKGGGLIGGLAGGLIGGGLAGGNKNNAGQSPTPAPTSAPSSNRLLGSTSQPTGSFFAPKPAASKPAAAQQPQAAAPAESKPATTTSSNVATTETGKFTAKSSGITTF